MAIKSKAHEKLSFDNIERVIQQLEQDNPITKKEACGMLNIRYNTTRLQRIIEDHQELKQFRETRKAQNKGKMATQDEIRSVVKLYLDGDNISANFKDGILSVEIPKVEPELPKKNIVKIK